MNKKIDPDYQTLHTELESILAQLQHPDVQVDAAVELYERGLVVLAKLEKHLTVAENKLTKLKLQASSEI